MITNCSRNLISILFLISSVLAMIQPQPMLENYCTTSVCTSVSIPGIPYCGLNHDFPLIGNMNVSICNGVSASCFSRTTAEMYVVQLPNTEENKRNISNYICVSKDETPCNIPYNRPSADYYNGDPAWCNYIQKGIHCIPVQTPCYCVFATEIRARNICVDSSNNNHIMSQIQTDVYKYVVPKVQTISPFRRILDSKLIAKIIKEDTLLVKCPYNKDCVFNVGWENFTHTGQCNGVCKYTLNPAYKHNPMNYHFSIASGSDLYYGKNRTDGTNYCETKDCIFCSDIYDNPECYSTWELVVFWGTIALSAAILLILILLVVLSISKCIYNKIRSKKSLKAKEEINTANQTGGYKRREPKTGVRSTPRRSVLSSALVVILMISFCSACDFGMSAYSDSYSCVRTQTEERCTYTFSYSFTINAVGQTACLTVVTPEGEAIDQLELGYLSFENESPSILDFYTSSWRTEHSEDAECEDTFGDCDDDLCSDVNQQIFKTPANIPSYYSSYPERIRCDMLQWSSCFYKRGCNYNAWILIPEGDIQKSYKHSYIIPTSTISLKTSQSDEQIVNLKQNYLQTGSLSNNSTYEFLIDGWLGTTEKMNVKDFSNVFYPSLFVDSRGIKGDPKVGTLFELQSPTTEDLTFPSTTNLLYGDLCSYNAINWESSAVMCTQPAIKSNVLPKLPLNTESGLVSPKTNEQGLSSIMGVYTIGPSVQMTTRFKNMVVVRKIETCDNDFEFVDAKGCYSCQSGTDLEFKSKSDLDCTWKVTSNTLKVAEASINSKSKFSLRSYPTSPDNSHTITFSNTAFSHAVKVRFTASEPDTELNPWVNGTIKTDGHEDIEDDDDEGFKLTTLLKNIIITIAVILAVVLIIGIVILIIYCIFQCLVSLCIKKMALP